jgi:ribosomal protein S18 acetylase RimI-like enzyme
MIKEITDIAFKLELEKLIAEVPDVNISAINAFTKAGFYRVATIPNLVKDRENRPLDVVVMIKDIRPARDETYEYDF